MHTIIETNGNLENISDQETRLSIRLEPDGFSFLAENSGTITDPGITADDKGNRVYYRATGRFDNGIADGLPSLLNEIKGINAGETIIYFATPKACLIPAEIYSSECAESYLSALSIPVSEEEEIIEAGCKNGTVILVVIEKGVADAIRSLSVANKAITHPIAPLIDRAANNENGLYIDSSSEFFSLVLQNNGIMHCADIVPVRDTQTLLFYIKNILTDAGAINPKIFYGGVRSDDLHSILSVYFNNITPLPHSICE